MYVYEPPSLQVLAAGQGRQTRAYLSREEDLIRRLHAPMRSFNILEIFHAYAEYHLAVLEPTIQTWGSPSSGTGG